MENSKATELHEQDLSKIFMLMSFGQIHLFRQVSTEEIFQRPGVAGAVLQAA